MSQYPKGIYVLRIRFEEPVELEIGSLTSGRFHGDYLYVGSALGPGGLKRVGRHLEVANGTNNGGHWHVDHLTKPGKIVESWLIPTEQELECTLAGKLAREFAQPVEGFGASDCSCYSHLFAYDSSKKEFLIRQLQEVAPGAKPVRFDWK
ncbi:MAG: GIY-YIG nuclease family protein [Candidatus Acetothermia bacterium]